MPQNTKMYSGANYQQSAVPPALRKKLTVQTDSFLTAPLYSRMPRRSFSTLVRNVHWRTNLPSVKDRFQPVCSRAFPLSSPPNGALSRWRHIPVSLWKQESPSTLYLTNIFDLNIIALFLYFGKYFFNNFYRHSIKTVINLTVSLFFIKK